MKTLHLTLKRQWYDMIARGEKTEEYREIKPYWMKRLCSKYKSLQSFTNQDGETFTWTCNCMFDCFKVAIKYDSVCFHCGYTNRTMVFEIKGIHVGKGKPEWGAQSGKFYFVIKLGERI